MTARGTVFLALEDETGMVNVTLWPDTWARLRGVVRRHALLLVDGDLQREGEVVNVDRARGPAAGRGGGDGRRARAAPEGVRQIGHAGMRRLDLSRAAGQRRAVSGGLAACRRGAPARRRAPGGSGSRGRGTGGTRPRRPRRTAPLIGGERQDLR